MIPRKKICKKCGRLLWLRDYYLRTDGRRTTACKECVCAAKREEYARNRKKRNGIYKDLSTGRLMNHQNEKTSIHWTRYMLERLERNYATTKNDELAIDLDVSVRTLIRKARELGLVKDKAWMQAHARANCKVMSIVNRHCRNSGMFKKGQHASPATEFKKKTRTTISDL